MDSAELRALEARRTSRDAPVTAPALGPPRAAERMRIPTGENRAPQKLTAGRLARRVDARSRSAGQRPRTDARAAGADTGAARGPLPRTAQTPASPGRSFLIGALIGTVLLGAAVAVVVSKRGGVGGATSHPAQPAP